MRIFYIFFIKAPIFIFFSFFSLNAQNVTTYMISNYPLPSFNLTALQAICEGTNLNAVLSTPIINNGNDISAWEWLLDGITLLSSSNSEGGSGSTSNCEIGNVSFISRNWESKDLTSLNLTVTDFTGSYFTGTINTDSYGGLCPVDIITPTNPTILTYMGGYVCHDNVTEIKWYSTSTLSSTYYFPVDQAYGAYVYPLGTNPCDWNNNTPPEIFAQNIFNQYGWIYADITGKITYITTKNYHSSFSVNTDFYDIALNDPSCSAFGDRTGSIATLEVPNYIVSYSDSGKRLVLIVENSDGASKDSIELIVNPKPAIGEINKEIYLDGSINLIFTGTPPFVVNYIVDKHGDNTVSIPSVCGFPTTFNNGVAGVENWISTGNNTYTCTITPDISGIYSLIFTEITDGTGCVSRN